MKEETKVMLIKACYKFFNAVQLENDLPPESIEMAFLDGEITFDEVFEKFNITYLRGKL